jgi:ethanolamine utilization microcompartment shell protein EutL
MPEMTLQEPEWIFPFDGMEIGDAFFIPTVKPADMLYKIDTCAKMAKLKMKAYTSSKEGHLGVRVWRVG